MPLTPEQLETFPETVRDWDEVKNSDSPEVVWDRIGNMRAKFGTALFKPGEDAGNEDWGKFTAKAVELSGGKLIPRPDLEDEDQRNALYQALGRPETEGDYEFEEIEGVVLDDTQKALLGTYAFENGLSKNQLKKFEASLRQMQAETLQRNQIEFDAEHKALLQEWGIAHENKVLAAKKIAKIFFPHIPEGTEFTAAELKAFSGIAKQLGKDSKEFSDHDNNNPNVITPVEAADQIAEIRNNAQHPYFDPSKPGHAQAKAKMRALYRVKNGLQPE